MIAVSVIHCHCHLSGCSTAVLTRGTPELSLEEQNRRLRFSPPAHLWECPRCSWPGWGNVQETVVVTRMTGAGPQAVMRSRIISIILHCGDRLQSVACHLQPVVTTFITLSYHSYNSYNSCPNLTWFLSIYHMTSPGVTSVKWLHIPHSAQPSSPDPLLVVCVPCTRIRLLTPCWLCTGVCCMCTALLTKW